MKALFSLLLLVFSLPSTAEQLKRFGDLEVHYSSFASTFLTPDIASHYKIQRSRYGALVNISVFDTSKEGKPAVSAQLTGTARNILGQQKTLTFREIKEGKSIYSIAQFKHTNDETLDFKINIFYNGKKEILTFKQTFFVDK
ncbi:DUF4426 domain-containing protein [Photobacterium leiognathi]|uniref:DUF4426 domain-containing protein n=1 Tax=Photobacterium leiognathi TaxID=553611 RepID=UPI002981E43F|nr:DUF4426 domain-containing protein [Photobacterium leiognathi]